MTFEEWKKHNEYLFTCPHDVHIARTVWMEARAYPEDLTEKFTELKIAAANLYFMLGTVCHDYQVELTEGDKADTKKALAQYREYRGY
jgi:hypothetical protein